ncbi:hypothetical protein [Xanthomonas sp. LMG 9002]|uniref:hypothetical protein n=1 Tax=Xanthomonas sp. LMG 9002 TaxID=1591158 RepID=UPI00136E07B0|nr:hypothetical protein [Xanthomonas sp. LMG 9002]
MGLRSTRTISKSGLSFIAEDNLQCFFRLPFLFVFCLFCKVRSHGGDEKRRSRLEPLWLSLKLRLFSVPLNVPVMAVSHNEVRGMSPCHL